MANFRVGQKVVCINAQDLGQDDGIIVKGHVYTVRGTIHQVDYTGSSHNCIKLSEVVRPECRITGQPDMGFRSDRFRPLITQSDDVEMFKRISEDAEGRMDILEEMLNEQFHVDETQK